jgi:hypothetical protein
MNLMISETTSQYELERTRANASVDTICYLSCESVLGQVLVARSLKGGRRFPTPASY